MAFLAPRELAGITSVTRVYNLNNVFIIRFIKECVLSKLEFRSK